MLDELPRDEFSHWIYSLALLHNGDGTMLVRSTPSRTVDDLPRMTPAPGKTRARADAGSYKKPVVKKEAIDSNVSPEVDELPRPVFSTRATIEKQDSGTPKRETFGIVRQIRSPV